jgi:hypothetical protein
MLLPRLVPHQPLVASTSIVLIAALQLTGMRASSRLQEAASTEDPVGQDLVLTLDVGMRVEEVHQQAAPRSARGEDDEAERCRSGRTTPGSPICRQLARHAPDRDERPGVPQAIE